MTRITGTLRVDLCTFMIISLVFLLKLRNVSDKCCRENKKTHFIFNKVFQQSGRLLNKVENTVEPGRLQMTIWRMRIACWMPKAADTLSEYVIVIAFPLQQFFARKPLTVTLCVHCLSCIFSRLFISEVINRRTWTFQWQICPIGCHEVICGVGVRGLCIFDLGSRLLCVVNFKSLLL